jgi:hypothetical protein
MEDLGTEDGTPSSLLPAAENRATEPRAHEDGKLPATAGGQVPWLLLVRLGFVVTGLIIAVALIAMGYTAAAAVGLVLGVGLAATEIIKRLG